jgi:hypothetical protein
MNEQQTELKLVTGMMGTSVETKFLENMKDHKYLHFNRRDHWDNSDQFRAFKCNKLPTQIYFDLFDIHNILVGKRNADIIERITGAVVNPSTWWGKNAYKYYELDDEKLNILFTFLSNDD